MARKAARKRRWIALVGGVIGWGIAGLEGGNAGTVDVPPLNVDFAAAGTVTAPELGTVPFGLAANSSLVRQVLLVANDRVEMVFDRMAAKVTIIDSRDIVVFSADEGIVSLIDPFARAEQTADGPLSIVRAGIGSHLGHACERYKAFGTADGEPLSAAACITSDGIPLVTEIVSADLTIRTELTEIDFASPDPRHFAVPAERAAIDAAGG
jgi:hypothetical protein